MRLVVNGLTLVEVPQQYVQKLSIFRAGFHDVTVLDIETLFGSSHPLYITETKFELEFGVGPKLSDYEDCDD